MTELISKIGGTILVVGMILAVRKSETYLAKSLRDSRDSHEIAKDEPQKKEVEWVYNKRERLWYPYLNGELLFKDDPNNSERPNNSKVSEIPTGLERSSE